MSASADSERVVRAAEQLVDEHRRQVQFTGLAKPFAPTTDDHAYAIQCAYVARRCELQATAVAGYKIALTTPAMRTMVGYHDSISGCVLADSVLNSGASVKASRYGRLIVEFELAFRIGRDVDRVYDRAAAAAAVDQMYPALEIADDRNADYSALAANLRTLIADNAWNEGLVLGAPAPEWREVDLAAVIGIAKIDGVEVGRGSGRDVLGHPLDALAWLINHRAALGEPLRAGSIVTTGSLVQSKFPSSGQHIGFEVTEIGAVQMAVV